MADGSSGSYKIAVLIKQVPDMNAVRIDKATGKPILSGQLAISSYDDYAIEEALRIKETHGGEITAISAGPASVKDAVTRALAMGADSGVIIPIDDVNALDTLQLAEALAGYLGDKGFDLIFAGQVADDYSTGQVGPQVAELLGIPAIGSIVKVEPGDGKVTALRDTEDGRQTIEAPFPVMLLAQAGLNEPRYPSLKGIMAAKKKPLETAPAPELRGESRAAWGEPYVPEKTMTGTVVQDMPANEAAAALVAWLREQKLV